MTVEQKIWVDHTRWSDSWRSLKKLVGGGQGVARRARKIRDGRTAFLKAIKAKGNPERRTRFFREASAYDTIRVQGIPGLIESNAHQWENFGVGSYMATGFIEGPILCGWLEREQEFNLDTAVGTAKKKAARGSLNVLY